MAQVGGLSTKSAMAGARRAAKARREVMIGMSMVGGFGVIERVLLVVGCGMTFRF